MLASMVSSVLGRFTSSTPPEYVVVDRCRSISGLKNSVVLGALTPSGSSFLYFSGDTIHVKKRNPLKTSKVDTLDFSMGDWTCMCVGMSETHVFVPLLHGYILMFNLTLRSLVSQKFSFSVRKISVVGRRLLTISSFSQLQLWELSSDSQMLTLLNSQIVELETEVTALALSPSDSMKGLVASGNIAFFMDFKLNRTIFTLTGHTDSIRACAIQGYQAITGSFDMTARVRGEKTTIKCM